jgi:type IV secretion system protein VirB1
MPLDLVTLQTLAATCAPAVAPATLLAIGKVESGFDPLAIGVNGPRPRRLSFRTPEAAVSTAEQLIAEGANVDLGLGQINMRNLPRLGLSVAAAFDPCRNLAASAKVLVGDYLHAAPAPGGEQAALLTALSYYNTGRPDRGFANGYVAKVAAAAGEIVPALTGAIHRSPPPPDATPGRRPAWAVFGGAARATFVLSPNSGATP